MKDRILALSRRLIKSGESAGRLLGEYLADMADDEEVDADLVVSDMCEVIEWAQLVKRELIMPPPKTGPTFYRTVFTVEVLSKEPIPEGETLENLLESAIANECCAAYEVAERHSVSATAMTRLLREQGSDPDFFQEDK